MSIGAINARNQFRGRVREIVEGPVVSEIDIETASGFVLTSVITTRSVRELGCGRQGGDCAGDVDRGRDRGAVSRR